MSSPVWFLVRVPARVKKTGLGLRADLVAAESSGIGLPSLRRGKARARARASGHCMVTGVVTVPAMFGFVGCKYEG